MAGELWRSNFQIGKQVTAGTPVAATRRMYFRNSDSRLSYTRTPTVHRYATGTRQNARSQTLGSSEVGGTLVQVLSASEIVELLLMGIKGGVTPTGTTNKTWVFTPGEALDMATVEWHDGARVWQAAETVVNTLQIAGDVKSETIVTAGLIGGGWADLGGLTAALPERLPEEIQGWETKLFVDTMGGTPGTTQLLGTLINWNVAIDNMITRKYHAQCTQDATNVALGEFGVTATLTFEAAPSTTKTEFDNWDGQINRLVRLDFGCDADTFITVDVPGAWSAVDLGGEDEGTRVYELSFQGLYDVTNAYGLQIIAQNQRATAW